MNTIELTARGIEYAPGTEALFTLSALSNLVTNKNASQEWKEFYDSVYDSSKEERQEIFKTNIRLAGDPRVDQDTRDLALGICGRMLHLEIDIDKTTAIESYCMAIDELGPDDDDLGAPLTLMELGKVLKDGLGNADTFDEHINLKGKFVGAWNRYEGRFNNVADHKPAWLNEAYALGKDLIPFTESAAEVSPQWEWSRKVPDMSEKQKNLHDSFLRVVRKQGSFKQFMFSNSKDFQTLAKEHNVDPAGYWNINDPEVGLVIVKGFENLSANLKDKFEKKLKAYDLKLADIKSKDTRRFFSGLVILAGLSAFLAYKDCSISFLTERSGSSADLYNSP